MSTPFRTIGLIGKHDGQAVADTLRRLHQDLGDRGLQVILDDSAAAHLPEAAESIVSRAALAEQADLAIVVGGDGTLLSAARSLVDAGVALLGVNLGRLGFLADVSPDQMAEQLDAILAGQFAEESRSMLQTEVWRDGECVNRSDAVNDAVIHKWHIARMIELETHIDERFVYALRADGLIVSTPTGSTAYALSGGGPILDPTLRALVLVPICPHTLSNRPIVVSDKALIDVLVHGNDGSQAQITCDGQMNFNLLAGDRVRISRKEAELRLIHPCHHDHFDIMRRKLRWAEQP